MSHYYGGIQGNRQETTRGGSKDSGYSAWAQDNQRQIAVRLWTCDDTGRTMFVVWVRASSINYSDVPTVTLFRGYLDEVDTAALLMFAAVRLSDDPELIDND
jgi:hypothetical protein